MVGALTDCLSHDHWPACPDNVEISWNIWTPWEKMSDGYDTSSCALSMCLRSDCDMRVVFHGESDLSVSHHVKCFVTKEPLCPCYAICLDAREFVWESPSLEPWAPPSHLAQLLWRNILYTNYIYDFFVINFNNNTLITLIINVIGNNILHIVIYLLLLTVPSRLGGGGGALYFPYWLPSINKSSLRTYGVLDLGVWFFSSYLCPGAYQLMRKQTIWN